MTKIVPCLAAEECKWEGTIDEYVKHREEKHPDRKKNITPCDMMPLSVIIDGKESDYVKKKGKASPSSENAKEKCWYYGCDKTGYPNAYWEEKSVYFCEEHKDCDTKKVV